MKILRKNWPMTLAIVLVIVLGLAVVTKVVVKAQTGFSGQWSSASIDSTGNVQGGGSEWTVTSQGMDTWQTSDSIEYGYQVLNGDGQIIARVLSISGTTNGWAKAGVMIRETLDPHSRQATMTGTLSKGLAFLWRAEAGDVSGSTHGTNWIAPYWVKLVRYGNCLAGYQSQDGNNWQLVNWQIVEMSQQVYVGLVVSSDDPTNACTAQFDQVQVSSINALDGLPLVGNGQGLQGEYFTNTDLSGSAVMVRQDQTVDFDWGSGAPMELGNSSQFSIRWTGEIQAQFSEPYTFYFETDDGVRVWLDGQQIIDDWVGRYNGLSVFTTNLVAGQTHQLQVEYFQGGGVAHAHMLWSSPSTPKRLVPQSQLYLPASANDLLEEPQEQPTLPWASTPGSVLGSGWDHGDIGVLTGGGASVSNGVFTATGYGPDIGGQADGFHYVYQPLTGNGQIIARVLGMAGDNPWAKAGLMIRETLDAGSKEATLACTPAHGVNFFWRAQAGTNSYSIGGGRLDTPYWLKVVRWNDLVGGFFSTNGTDWELADWERVNMGQQIYVGLAVSSADKKKLCTGWFDQVSVSSLDTAPDVLPVVGTGDGLKADYFSNMELTGEPALTRTDSIVNFVWGVHPPLDVPYGEHFSTRWTGEIQARFTGPTTFYLRTDDGVRVWLNENLIIDDWVDRYEGESTATVNLTAGQHYLLRIEYYQDLGGARAQLRWSGPVMTKEIVPQSQLYSQPQLDPDGSGLPVLWELHYFGQTGIDPNSIPSGNGLTVLQSYEDGTDPLVFSSAGDGIPDGWAVAHGLNPLDPSVATQDPDEDGLNNLQEYQAGTDPNIPCSKIAGVPDGVTVLYLQTNSATVYTEASANGAQGTPILGQWQTNGTDLCALDRRGLVQYTLSTENADKLLLRVDGTQNQEHSPVSTFDLILYVDGECLGHHPLQAGYGANGAAVCLVPYLKPGQHTVQVFWDGAASYSSLRIKQVSLQSIAGPDGNGNGVKDWVDRALFTESGHDSDLTTGSYISPAFIEGRDPYLSMMTFSSSGTTVPINPGAGPRWYANVPLSAQADTAVSISYQNGGETESASIPWLPVNVLTSSDLIIRTGDSLLLGIGTNQSASVSVAVQNGSQTTYTVTAGQPVSCQFASAGTYTITANTQSMTVTVVSFGFPTNPVCMTGQVRVWPLTNFPSQLILQVDPRVQVTQTNPASLGLIIDQNLPRTLVARLGNSAPIVASSTAQGMRLFASADTYDTIIQQYPDGSELVETMIVLSPVLPNVTVQVRVIVGGVTFDDGTLYKMLTPADFDALGQCKLRFLLPSGAQTSNCHSIQVMQGNAVVGDY